jgi:hypothetical protein
MSGVDDRAELPPLPDDAPEPPSRPGPAPRADPPTLLAGSPRRRLGNFRTSELATRVQEVLAEAGIPTSRELDPRRPERWGRFLEWIVHMTGAGGNRVWVPRERFRESVDALREARRQGR